MAGRSYLPFYFWEEPEGYDLDKHFWPPVVNYALWPFLIPFVYHLMEKFPLRRKQSGLKNLKAVLIGLALACSHEIISYVIYYSTYYMTGGRENWEMALPNLASILPGNILLRWVEYWIIFGIFSAFDYQRQFRDEKLMRAQAEQQLSDVRLRALKAQLRPHFLFNTLNTVSALAESDPKQSQQVISELGGLLRTFLDNSQSAFQPLQEEIRFVRSYLHVEQVRFHDRLQVEFDIEEKCLGLPVPALVMQPLVENAIKHAATMQTEPCRIVVKAACEPGRLLISVSDNGPGSRAGVGLHNLAERLSQRYGEQSSIQIDTAWQQGFSVALTIPQD